MLLTRHKLCSSQNPLKLRLTVALYAKGRSEKWHLGPLVTRGLDMTVGLPSTPPHREPITARQVDHYSEEAHLPSVGCHQAFADDIQISRNCNNYAEM